MDTSRNTCRVIGQRRAELDIKRFAEAMITFALHRVRPGSEATEQPADVYLKRNEESSP